MKVTFGEAIQEIETSIATLRQMLARENDPARASALGHAIVALDSQKWILEQVYQQVTMELRERVRVADLRIEQQERKEP